MPYFHRVPSGERISNTTVIVEGPSLTVGLNGSKDANGNDVSITNSGNDLVFLPAGTSSNSKLYTISVTQRAQATQATVADTVFATGDLSKPPADSFNIEFRFKTQPAREVIVRDTTKAIFGVEQFAYVTPTGPMIATTSFRPGDPSNVFDFVDVPGRPVSLRVFAAKFGNVERACWLMLPLNSPATSLMVVISHGFGANNNAYYTNLGYSNPLSKALLEDVRDRFILFRWGQQVAATRPNMGLIMPVRASTGGSELGPFVSQQGIGYQIVTNILLQAEAQGALADVSVVTFSSGIFDANTFTAVGGKGLKFGLMVNQDPALGTTMTGRNRRQYLSGYTAHGPRAGFEFMPMPRWQNDPKLEEMKRRLGREYLHTWALPTYTLALALRTP
jgi:hypothetical protein